MKYSFFHTLRVSSYLYLIILMAIGLFLVSGYIYKLRPHRFEPFALYYPSASTNTMGDIDYVPEIRNIPVQQQEFPSFFSFPNFLNIERLIEELILGPQNIYAKHVLPKSLHFSKVFTEKNSHVFIIFSLADNLSRTEDMIEEAPVIEHWIMYNIKKYFKFDSIHIIYDIDTTLVRN